MLGYCSNSPLRCEKAHSMILLNQVDTYCPECGLFLLPTQNLSRQLRADERFLQYTFLITGLVLLACVYLYYLNFA
jgi:RNase P subunit RPR2